MSYLSLGIILCTAFQQLQSALPAVPPSTKLSKLDVLLMASAYIAHLGRLMEENGQDLVTPTGHNVTTFHPVKVLSRVLCITVESTHLKP